MYKKRESVTKKCNNVTFSKKKCNIKKLLKVAILAVLCAKRPYI